MNPFTQKLKLIYKKAFSLAILSLVSSCVPSVNEGERMLDLMNFSGIFMAEITAIAMSPSLTAPVITVSPGPENGSVILNVSTVPFATEYRIYYSADPQVSITNYTGFLKIQGPSAMITGLVVNVPYFFKATAYSDILGESPESAVATISLPY